MLRFEKTTLETRIILPDGTAASRPVEIRTDPAPVPGVYRINSAAKTLRQVSVHLGAEEGRLRYTDADRLAASLGEGVRVLHADDRITDRVLEDRIGREIWRELLLEALLLILAETVVGRVRLA